MSELKPSVRLTSSQAWWRCDLCGMTERVNSRGDTSAVRVAEDHMIAHANIDCLAVEAASER